MTGGLGTLCLDANEVRARVSESVGDDGVTDAERDVVAREYFNAVAPTVAELDAAARWLRRKRESARSI